MDGYRFDRWSRRLAQSRFTRRAGLRAGGLGLAGSALAGVGLALDGAASARGVLAAQATPESQADNLDAIQIGDAWFCDQVFALCTTAPCELSTSDPTIANCQCIVENSYAIGFKSCTERAQSGNKLYSNFSDVNVNSEFGVMTCPKDAPWANCLDMPCEIDALNPAQAVCQCEMVETGPSLTWGGGCDTNVCTTVIWSAAPTDYLGLAQYEEGLSQVGLEPNLPPTCPAAPAASPAATPV